MTADLVFLCLPNIAKRPVFIEMLRKSDDRCVLADEVIYHFLPAQSKNATIPPRDALKRFAKRILHC